MLMEGFLVTAALEPHRLFLAATAPASASPAPPSVETVDVLLPAEETQTRGSSSPRREQINSQMDGLLSAEQKYGNKFLQVRRRKEEIIAFIL